jgi:hypothetical protein
LSRRRFTFRGWKKEDVSMAAMGMTKSMGMGGKMTVGGDKVLEQKWGDMGKGAVGLRQVENPSVKKKEGKKMGKPSKKEGVEIVDEDDKEDDGSDKTPPKDNGAVGRDNARKGWMAFQVTKGAELPIFQAIHPR